ncbi:MAG: DNA polymerase III subunit delta [Nitrospirae bacterium RIFCSPLOWO2_12_FULL_63_8]|nr:MAG: DNA polymerase III subunit delta [Nitrospirae bacterium RIFCSPLOWO2_12_FULL_63_8]
MKALEVETALKQHGLAPLYLVMGEEDCLRDQAVAALKAAVLGDSSTDGGMDAFNYDVLYGDESDGSEILARAGQAPVFAARRYVVVKSAEKLSAKDGEALMPYVKEPGETTTLVFVAPKLDKRLKFSKELMERAVSVDCSSIPDMQLSAWIRAESGRAGVRLSEEAAGALSHFALSLKGEEGGSLNRLRRELEKLASYVPSGKTAGLQDIEAVRGGESGASVFDLAKAIAERREGRALWILARNLEAGEDALRILGALAWQFRQIWKAKEQRRFGGPGADVSGLFTDRDLGTALQLFAAADAKLKGGVAGSSKRMVLETVVLSLCRFKRDGARGTQARGPAPGTQNSGRKGTSPHYS